MGLKKTTNNGVKKIAGLGFTASQNSNKVGKMKIGEKGIG